MRYGVRAGNPAEGALMAAGLVPGAMFEGYAPMYARALVLAVEMGMLDAIAAGSTSADAVADAGGTDPRATAKLLNLLVSMGYLSRGRNGYRLTAQSRRFLTADAPSSVRDLMLMKRLEWRWIEALDDFVRSGRPLDVHDTMDAADWQAYQRGMRAQANVAADLIARFVPVPTGATEMLDIGGSHGYFSVVLCRRHPRLRATVLDLPEAVEHAAPLLAREGMGDRVLLQAGDALADDLGEARYDLIFMFSLIHHFSEEANRELVARCAKALRPGGVLVVGDVMRPDRPGRGGQQAAFFDLYFALTSQAGLWTIDEIRSWQREAGLRLRRARRIPFSGGMALLAASRE